MNPPLSPSPTPPFSSLPASPRRRVPASATYLTTALLVATLLIPTGAQAQKPPEPEIGYIFPPGGKAGTTVDVKLGAVDWTPDMQLFVLDSRVRIEPQGSLEALLLPEPPYFIGTKAYNPPPLPRELAAKVIIPANMPAGPVRWQVANANGTSQTGMFVVGDGTEVVERDDDRTQSQLLADIPVTVSGRLRRNEEVDRYRFRATLDGPITCALDARRIGSPMSVVLEVRDESGNLLAEAVDTRGDDVRLTFAAKAQQEYTLSLRELDFRGHWSFVYRLNVAASPRVVAAIPAAGPRGETRKVELVGYGISTGTAQLETAMRDVVFPDDKTAARFIFRLETPFGPAAFSLLLSELDEQLEPPRVDATPPTLVAPAAITGALDQRYGTDRYRFAAKKDEAWQIDVEAAAIGSPLDVTLKVVGSDGTELSASDDAPGTTDATLVFTAPADGAYDIVIGDVSGESGSFASTYRLVVRRPVADFSLELPQRLNVVIGEKIELPIKAVRTGGFNEPIAIVIDGLPPGVSSVGELVIPAGASELKVALQSSADSPATASLVTATGTARIGDRELRRVARAQAAGNLAPRTAEDNAVAQMLIASTMKPRTRIWPVESDERTVHRGSTHPAEIAVERLEGFNGDVLIQMESKQGPKFRQGLTGPDVVLPSGRDRLFYPCFVPEMAETLDAYRISMVAIAKVPDPRGNIRYLLSKMPGDTSVGITVEGGLLKIAGPTDTIKAEAGKPIDIPITISRSPRLAGALHLDLEVPKILTGEFAAEAIDVPPGRGEANLRVNATAVRQSPGTQRLVVRGVVLEPGTLPQLDESAGCTPMDRRTLDFLKQGYLPVIAQTAVMVEF